VLLAVFAVWEHRAAAPMVPPALLRARSFAASCLVYMLSTAGLTGAMFYLTLLYQDVRGWSVLRNRPVLAVHEHSLPDHRPLRTRPGSRQPGTPTAEARLSPDPGEEVRSGQS
jgi:hypothetical protein